VNALVLDAGGLIAIDRDVHKTVRDAHRAGLSDAIDASVALLAETGDRVLTSDPGDLRMLCEAAGNRVMVVRC
jgi:hypothetical protein